jgi:hypothetical protein
MDSQAAAAIALQTTAATIGAVGAVAASVWSVGWGSRGRRNSIVADRRALGNLPAYSPSHQRLADLIDRRVARHIAVLQTQRARLWSVAWAAFWGYASVAVFVLDVVWIKSSKDNPENLLVPAICAVLLMIGLAALVRVHGQTYAIQTRIHERDHPSDA